MNLLRRFDESFIQFSRNYYQWIARISLFIIFFYFGFLKLIGLSPASELITGFTEKMGLGEHALFLFYLLAAVECLIGLLMLLPKLTRLTILIMIVHMALASSPLILYTEAVWQSILVPNLEGQYIIKNVALVALALGLVATTKPLTEKS
jgi:uncharacterized membrane protein YphA (DoxX/SURF4 family)